MSVKPSEQNRAQKCLNETVKQQTIEIKEGFDELVSSSEWKRLRQNLCSSGSVQVFIDVSEI